MHFAVPLDERAGHETLAAVGALIRPLARVKTQVQHQRRPLREALAALRADMRPFTGVRPPVNAQVLLAGEFLVARAALEDLLARVSAFMHGQSSPGRQLRAAQVAQMLGGRTPEPVLILHVLPQQPLVDESLRAELARVPRTRVALRAGRPSLLAGRVLRRQVHRQVFLVEVALVTVFAAVEILVGVRVPVLQVLGLVVEAPLASLALETVVLRVPTTMALQVGLLVGAVVAEVAGEHLQPRVDQLVAGYVHRAAERFVALVAAEGAVDVVQILQVLDELPRVPETGAALDALVHGARLASSLPETKKGRGEISG